VDFSKNKLIQCFEKNNSRVTSGIIPRTFKVSVSFKSNKFFKLIKLVNLIKNLVHGSWLGLLAQNFLAACPYIHGSKLNFKFYISPQH